MDSDTGEIRQPFFRYVDTNGDGSGDKDMNGDYSGAPETFFFQPAGNNIARVARMIMLLESPSGYRTDRYAGIAALTNGIQMKVIGDEGEILDILDGRPIKHNADFAAICYDAEMKDWGVGGGGLNELLVVRFTFEKSGKPLRLEGSKSERFEVTLNDNFSTLIHHSIMLQGYYESQAS